MNRGQIGVILAFVIAFGLVTATTSGQDKPKKTFFSGIKEGQTISVREVGGRYEIIVMKRMPVVHKVLEVGIDYILVEDPASVTETRIPVYSIKSIAACC